MTIAPERPNIAEDSPHPKRWTVEEADRLSEAGFLSERYEVIEGEIYEKMPPNRPHSITLILLTAWLHRVFEGEFVQTQMPVSLPGPYNRPEPDAAITRDPTTAYHDRDPEPADLLLAVEVSDTTLRFDLTTKAAHYGQGGIMEYWILDVSARRVIVHRQPGAEGYADIQKYDETAQIAPLARPEALVTVASLFPPLSAATGQA